MTETIDPQPILYALCGVGVVGAIVFLVVQRVREARRAPEATAVVPAPAPPPDETCPCGAVPTRALPRAEMMDLWVYRWWRRVVDSFGPRKVCGPCGRYADATLDERIAATVRHARARVEAEITREMASHERALLGVVIEALPEETRRAWARSQRPALPRVQPKVVDDGVEERTAT